MAATFLIVRARTRLCALPVEQVVETLRPPALVGGPGDVRGLLGTALCRGRVVPVLDFADLLGLPGASAEMGRAVSIRMEEGFALFVVDEAIGVARLEPGSLTKLELPGGAERQVGRFDIGFARLVDLSGWVDSSLLAARQPAQTREVTA